MKAVKRARTLHFMVSTVVVLGMLTSGQVAYGDADEDASDLVASCLLCGRETTQVITDEAGLKAMKADGCYELGADIVLATGKWHGALDFAGHFNGKSHQISGIVLGKASLNKKNGLFNTIVSGATVENLLLSGSTVSMEQIETLQLESIGFLAGRNAGLIRHVTVLNEALTYQLLGSGNAIGGLVGVNAGKIESSAFIGDMTIDGTKNATATGYVGGIAGKDNTNSGDAYTKQCFFYGQIKGAAQLTAGSILGKQGNVEACYTNAGSVESDLNTEDITAISAEALAERVFLRQLNAEQIGCWQWEFDEAGRLEPCATWAMPLVVGAEEATAVTDSGAVLMGKLASGETGPIYGRRISYGTDATLMQNVQTVEAEADFAVTVADLSPETVYYYRAEASNRLGDVSSAISCFTTLAKVEITPPPSAGGDSDEDAVLVLPDLWSQTPERLMSRSVPSGLSISSRQLQAGMMAGEWVSTGEANLSLSLQLTPFLQQQVLGHELALSVMAVAPQHYAVKLTEKSAQESKEKIFGHMRLSVPKSAGQWQAWDQRTGQPLPTAVSMVAGAPRLVVTCWQSGDIVLRPQALVARQASHWAESVRVLAAQRGIVLAGSLDAPVDRDAFLAMLGQGLGILPTAQSDLLMRRPLGLWAEVDGAAPVQQVLTRQTGIVYLMRAQRLVSGERQPESVGLLAAYADGDGVAQWAKADMAAAVAAGLVAGDGQGLHPEAPLTVAQALSLVMRLLEQTALI